MASLFNVCDETERVGKRLEKFGRRGPNNPNRLSKREHVKLEEVEGFLERATETYFEALLTARSKYQKISRDSKKGVHSFCCSKLPPTWSLKSNYGPTSPAYDPTSPPCSPPHSLATPPYCPTSPPNQPPSPWYDPESPPCSPPHSPVAASSSSSSNPSGLSLGYVPDDPSEEVPSFLPEAVPEKTKVVIEID